MDKYPDTITVGELVARFCKRQDATLEQVYRHLDNILRRHDVVGWVLLQCVLLDSSRLGELVIMPYGPGCTLDVVPHKPISPRGLASDMSIVVAVAPR